MGEMTSLVKEKLHSCSKPSALSTEQMINSRNEWVAFLVATQRKNVGINILLIINIFTLKTLQAEFLSWRAEKTMCGFKGD